MPAAITQEYLKSRVSYDPETGLFTWVEGGHKWLSGKVAGCVNSCGYIVLTFRKSQYFAHRLAVLYMTGSMPEEMVDHINFVRHDNRWINLREASVLHNNIHRGAHKDNKVGFKGVCKKSNSGYTASCTIKGKTQYLGTYATAELAHKAYMDFTRTIYGDFVEFDGASTVEANL